MFGAEQNGCLGEWGGRGGHTRRGGGRKQKTENRAGPPGPPGPHATWGGLPAQGWAGKGPAGRGRGGPSGARGRGQRSRRVNGLADGLFDDLVDWVLVGWPRYIENCLFKQGKCFVFVFCSHCEPAVYQMAKYSASKTGRLSGFLCGLRQVLGAVARDAAPPRSRRLPRRRTGLLDGCLVPFKSGVRLPPLHGGR